MFDNFEDAFKHLPNIDAYFKHVDQERKLIFIAEAYSTEITLHGFKFSPYDNVILKTFKTPPTTEELMNEINWQLERGDIFFDPKFKGKPGTHSSVHSWFSTEHERFRRFKKC